MKKKNKDYNYRNIILVILIITGLTIITIGFTQAYFVLTVNSNNNNINNSSGKIDIDYVKGTDINGVLYGTNNYLNGLSTTVKIKYNEGSVRAVVGFYLKIENIDDALKSTALRWAVYKNDSTISIKNGNFVSTNNGMSIQVVDDFVVPAEYEEYTLYVWLDGESSTNDMQNKTFNAKMYASANYISGTLE